MANFIPALAICFELPTAVRGGAEFLKRFTQDGGRADFSENLGANIFNKDISNELNLFLPDPSRWTVPSRKGIGTKERRRGRKKTTGRRNRKEQFL
jgi:hypothetical protein